MLLLPLSARGQEADSVLYYQEEEEDYPYYYEEAKEDYIAAERPPYQPPSIEPMAMRKIDPKQWDDASKGLDYSKDVPRPIKEKNTRQFNPGISGVDWTSATQGLGIILQTLAVLLATAAIAYGIWRMLQSPRNKQIARDGVQITLDNLDDYMHETDLDRFLREALEQKNYPLALRLCYLQVIKNLSKKNAIRWSREKTNRDYLREMSKHPLSNQFREATHIYERVWYGNQSLSEGEYAALEPKLKGALLG